MARFSHSTTTWRASLAVAATISWAGGARADVGNVDCGEAEYFRPLDFVENPTDGPNGTNVALITNGHLMVIFAHDSGRSPGEFGFYDLSDPRNLSLVRHLRTEDTEEFREQHSMPVALIDGKEYVALQTVRGIQIWDITDPASAAHVSSLDLPGVSGGDYDNVAWQTTWQGEYLYVAGSNLGVFIVDTSDLTEPRLLDQVSASKTGGFRIGPLFALGDYLVVSDMDQRAAIAVLDISRAAEPTLLGKIDNLPNLYATYAAGDRIYGSGREGIVTIHSFEDPTDIREVNTVSIGGDSLYVAFQDQFVFSGRQNSFIKVDVQDELNPQIVDQGELGRERPDHGQVTPFGNLIYIGNDHETGSAVFCHQLGPDLSPPGIDKVYPSDGSLGVATTSRIGISVSDYVDTRTINKQTVTLRPLGGEALDGIYTYAFNTISFSPDGGLAEDTSYELVLSSGLKDVMGNGLPEEVVVQFSTGAAIVAPADDPASPDEPGGMGPMAGTGGSASKPPVPGADPTPAAPTSMEPTSGTSGSTSGSDSDPPAGAATSGDSSAPTPSSPAAAPSSSSGGCSASGPAGRSKSRSTAMELLALLALGAWARRRT